MSQTLSVQRAKPFPLFSQILSDPVSIDCRSHTELNEGILTQHECKVLRKDFPGGSRLRLQTPRAGGPGFNPDQGTVLHAATKDSRMPLRLVQPNKLIFLIFKKGKEENC